MWHHDFNNFVVNFDTIHIYNIIFSRQPLQPACCYKTWKNEKLQRETGLKGCLLL